VRGQRFADRDREVHDFDARHQLVKADLRGGQQSGAGE
jgi:hypothetical protein